MAKKPVSALVMHPLVRDELLRDDHLQRLHDATDLLTDVPFRDFDELGDQAAEVELLITSWGCPRIDSARVLRMPRLRLLAHLAGSVKGFVDESLWHKGVQVTNAVAANAVPVAEYTVAAILFANKNVLKLSHYYRQYRENRAPWTDEAPQAGNYRKIVGIVSASHVGRLVIERLQPYDLRVVLYDPFITPLTARQLGARKVSLAELLSQAHVVSLHAPLLAETRGMIGQRELRLMRDNATLINTARGQLVDTQALIRELADGRLNAVLDTTDPEDLPRDSPLYTLPNVLLTPHIAGSLGDETQRLADHVVRDIERFVKGIPLKHPVRREQLSRLA